MTRETKKIHKHKTHLSEANATVCFTKKLSPWIEKQKVCSFLSKKNVFQQVGLCMQFVKKFLKKFQFAIVFFS